jgi:hypothetical protein
VSGHRRRLEEAARRRQEQRDRQARENQHPGGAGVTGAAPGGEVEVIDLPKPSPDGRPQPFTPDLIPEPELVNATGDLTPEELDELEHCERAVTNAENAAWMRGKALHALRDRRLYRPRTWPEYCEEVLGLSESEANRMIQAWPLQQAITQIWVTPKTVPESHIHTLLPLTEEYGLQATAQHYVMVRIWAAQNRQRVTAERLAAAIEHGQAHAPEREELLLAVDFQQAVRSAIPAQPGPAELTAGPTGSDAGLEPGPEASADQEDAPPDDDATEEEAGQGEPEVLDAEIIDDDQAKKVHDLLEGVRLGLTTTPTLRTASPETIKAIAETGRAIADAAEEALHSRHSPKFG